MHRGAQTWPGAWWPLPVFIPERLHRYWGYLLSSHISYSAAKGADAGSVWLRRICMCQQEIRWFFSNFRAIATIGIPRYWKKVWIFVFDRRDLLRVPFPSVEWWVRRATTATGFALEYFCLSLGNFTEKTMTKQFLCIWTRCVLWSLQDVPFNLCLSKHKLSPLANMSHPYTILQKILLSPFISHYFIYFYIRNLLQSMLT